MKLKTVVVGYRSAVYVRQGRMLGIRQPLDGPVFETLEHAEYWCWHAMLDHYERGPGMSDVRLEPFKDMLDS